MTKNTAGALQTLYFMRTTRFLAENKLKYDTGKKNPFSYTRLKVGGLESQTRASRGLIAQARPNQTNTDQTRPSRARPDQATREQTRLGQTRPAQARRDQRNRARPDQATREQTRLGQTRPDQARRDQTRPDETRPDARCRGKRPPACRSPCPPETPSTMFASHLAGIALGVWAGLDLLDQPWQLVLYVSFRGGNRLHCNSRAFISTPRQLRH